MRTIIFILITFALIQTTSAQKKDAYQIYTSKGKKTSYKKLLKEANKSDIILFGEQHNNPISHWLELELLKDMEQELIIGAEMMEADNQSAIDAYLKRKIDYKGLDSSARLWNNFKTDYLPLLDFAKQNKIAFIATNVPRRYASMVYKKGFESLDSLDESEKVWMAPLPIHYDAELPSYKKMMKMSHGHGGENLPKAQALKDATMAHFIIKNLEAGKTFVHYNGAYHSDNYEGILWYLKLEKPELNYLTITTVSQVDISKISEEAIGKADFIIVVDEDMTKTY